MCGDVGFVHIAEGQVLTFDIMHLKTGILSSGGYTEKQWNDYFPNVEFMVTLDALPALCRSHPRPMAF